MVFSDILPRVPTPWGWYYDRRTITINTPPPIGDEQIRRVVRQELAELWPIAVPDFPPEDL